MWSPTINLGNLLQRFLLADLVPDLNRKRMLFNTSTNDHWFINKAHKNQDKVIWRASATEMDNHSDTHCFGENYLPISLTSEECNLSPFRAEYTEQVNIPICTGAILLIEGSSAQAHIYHNIACSCRVEHRHESEIMSINY